MAYLNAQSDTALAAKPKDPDALTLLVERAVQRQDVEGASQRWVDRLHVEPLVEDHFLDALAACEKAKNPDRALWVLDRAELRFPRSRRVAMARADFFEKHADRPRLIRALRRWAMLEPKATEPLTRVADVLFNSGYVDEAGRHYVKALELDPANPQAQRRAALAAYFRGDRREAEERARLAVSMEPKRATNHQLLGQVLLDLGDASDRSRAEGELATAVRLQPDLAASHFLLGLALQDAGDWEGAKGHFSDCIAVSPEFRAASFHLARCEEALGFTERSRKLRVRHQSLEAAYRVAEDAAMQLAASPGDFRLLVRLARAERTLGRNDQAIRHLKSALALRPADRSIKRELAALSSVRETVP